MALVLRPLSRPAPIRNGRNIRRGSRRLEANWKALLLEIPVYAFEEYRHDRESRAEINTIRARGEKLLSQIPSSLMQCVCGVTFDGHEPDESYDHRRHIYAVYQRTRAATSLSEGERKAQPICDFFDSPLISD